MTVKVGDVGFDRAVHHPIYTANKLKRFEEELQKVPNMPVTQIVDFIEEIVKDLALYRQELLSSVEDD